MPNVDNRVVKMTFDNAEFERRVEQTIASLKRLEQATQFKGAKKGFSELDSAAKKVNLKPLSDQARDVDGRFKFTGAQKALADLGIGAKKVNLNPLIDKATEVDRSFKFTGAQKGLADLGRSASQVNMGGISEGAEEATSGISRMGAIALTTFGAISGAAVAMGGVIAAKVAGGPVMDGFHEMETNMNSIQTILANTRSKGSSLDDVTAALDKLNEYSDQTIYNFGEMARNIGTFTAAGVDLDTSVKSIKGIANLAALSGSSSEQASTAMYQLSQAISTGTVRLMDWNSVSNAGMGGELFKTALFETGKALGQINDVPLDTTFKEWEKSNGSFRDSLQDEWLNADVLTTTLAGMSGDLTQTQLELRGFSEEGAKQLLALGDQGKEAAQSVKTLTQLFGVAREAIGTGWADSFKAIFGNFDEAKRLFSGMSSFIGGFITRSAEARNKMLLDWKKSGGRLLLLLGFRNVVQTLLAVIDPIRKAFRDFFPKRTGDDLIKMTQAFYRFTEAIKPSEKTVKNIGLVFRGFFGALKVGWVILSETVKFLFDLGKAIFGLIAGPNLSGLGKFGSAIGSLAEGLISGNKVADFFNMLRGGIDGAVTKIREFISAVGEFLGKINFDPITERFDRFKNAIGGLFDNFDFSAGDEVSAVAGRVTTRWDQLIAVVETVGRALAAAWDWVAGWGDEIANAFSAVGDIIGDFFSNLGSAIKDGLGSGDFDGVKDALNVGLIGAFVASFAYLSKNFGTFVKNGLKFDFGDGFFKGLNKAFLPVLDQFTGVLKAMQLQLKAEALMKIAKAIAVLTVSLVVLSLLDSGRLLKSIAAVGWTVGILVAAVAGLSMLDASTLDVVKINLMVFAINGLAASLVLLGIAIAIFGNMDVKTLGQGMATIIVLLGGMVIVAQQLADHTGDFVGAAFGMTVMATALILLSGVITYLGNLDLDVLAKGLIGVGVTIALLAAAMNKMPKKEDATKAGIGMLFLSYAIKKMADAIQQFGGMSWMEIAKGLFTVNLLLEMIVRTIENIPVKDMIEVGLGMLAVAFGIKIIADAMGKFGDMSIEEIGRAMLALAGTMLILSVAVNAMSGAVVGAGSLLVVAGALLVLGIVLQTFAQMSFGELGMALLGVAAALLVISLAAYAITASGAVVAIAALGVALLALGVGMVLVGGGVYLLARGLQILADVGTKGIAMLGNLIAGLIKYIPQVVKLAKDFILGLMTGVLSGLPQIIELGIKIGGALLDGIIKLLPKAIQAIKILVGGLLDNAKALAPKFIELGFVIISNLLKGLDDNIEEIVNRGVEIIGKFLGVLAERAPELATMGAYLLIRFIEGITENIAGIVGAVLSLITTFLNAVAANIHMVVAAGLNIITQLLIGIGQGAVQVVATVTILILQFISALNTSALLLIAAGTQMIVNILVGITNALIYIAGAVTVMIVTFIGAIGDNIQAIIDAGGNMIIKLIEGIGEKAEDVIAAAVATAGKFLEGLVDNVVDFGEHVGNFIHEILTAMRNWVDSNAGTIRTDMLHVAGAILNGLTGGIASKAGKVVKAAMEELASHMPGWMKKVLGIKSPSKVFAAIGGQVVDGLAVGLHRTRPAEMAVNQLGSGITTAMNEALAILGNTNEFNPTITPVLDLTRVQADAGNIAKLMDSSKLSPKMSAGTARVISADLARQNGSTPAAVSPVVHEGPLLQQIINSPKALSQSEIYKQTKNLITLKKAELEIP